MTNETALARSVLSSLDVRASLEACLVIPTQVCADVFVMQVYRANRKIFYAFLAYCNLLRVVLFHFCTTHPVHVS